MSDAAVMQDINESIEAHEADKTARKLSKIDEKRIRQYQERRKRLINKGVPEDKVDQAIAEEDYRALPIEKKFERFQAAMQGSVKRLASDLMALRHNDGVLADVLESNSKSMARCLVKAGVSLEDQSVIIKEVEAELAAERERKIDAQVAAAKARSESQKAEAALRDAESPKADSAEGTAVPEEATTFGG